MFPLKERFKQSQHMTLEFSVQLSKFKVLAAMDSLLAEGGR